MTQENSVLVHLERFSINTRGNSVFNKHSSKCAVFHFAINYTGLNLC